MQRRVLLERLVPFAAVLALAMVAPRARAQEAQPLDDLQQSVWTDEQFDQWVDQIVGEINEQESPESGRLDTRLSLKLEWLEASCKISEAQKKKLRIAGRGDIKRFLDEMREMKRRFRQWKGDPIRFATMQNRLAEIQTSFGDDLLGEASLFSKTLHRTLSEEQAAMYRVAREESRVFAFRAGVQHAVRFFDMAVGFNEQERRKLTELYMEELKRPESAEISPMLAVVLRTTKLPRGKLKAIFDEKRQWKIMSGLLKQLEEGFDAHAMQGIFGGDDDPGMPADLGAEQPAPAKPEELVPENSELKDD